ncbi:MAG: DUF3800 domain-containing protein, partial [Terriglobales bacterium]
MQHIFVDESGDLGFGCGTAYFILAFIAPKAGKQLNKVIKNVNAHLLRNGWNSAVEIKATNICYAPKNGELPATYKYKNTPEVPMEYILKAIASVDGYIENVVVKLDTVSPGLQKADCAIIYNYFAWQLLKGPLCYFKDVELFVDRRNRETHNLLKFDGYIEGKAGEERASKGRDPLNLTIHHYHANSADEFKAEERARVEFGIRGLEAVDF